jgi:hypothetical protein
VSAADYTDGFFDGDKALISEGTCLGPDPGQCPADEYCMYRSEDYRNRCGYTPQSVMGPETGEGRCYKRPTACTDACPLVCACDGNVYCNECEAAKLGLDSIGFSLVSPALVSALNCEVPEQYRYHP